MYIERKSNGREKIYPAPRRIVEAGAFQVRMEEQRWLEREPNIRRKGSVPGGRQKEGGKREKKRDERR